MADVHGRIRKIIERRIVMIPLKVYALVLIIPKKLNLLAKAIFSAPQNINMIANINVKETAVISEGVLSSKIPNKILMMPVIILIGSLK